MFRFWKNLFFCSLLIVIVGFYCFQKAEPDYERYILSKYDGLYQEIIGGLIFIILLIVILRPSIAISPEIAELPANDDEPQHLRIKIVNYSIFKAYDIQINVYHKERTNVSGPDITSSLIGTYETYKVGIPYLESGFLASMEKEKTNAAQFRLSKMLAQGIDMKKLLGRTNSYVEVHVIVRHGLSGIKANFVKKFHNTTFIKSGYYAHGFNINIKT